MMKIVKSIIDVKELAQIAQKSFGNMIKGVVDVRKEVMAIDGELHSDEEALLIEEGSNNCDLWGINIYPELINEDWIEFDSMINLRPIQGNRSREVENSEIKKKIIEVVNKLVSR